MRLALSVLGRLQTQQEEPWVWFSQRSVGELPTEAISLTPFEVLLCLLAVTELPPSTLGAGGEKWVFHLAGTARSILPALLPPTGQITFPR